MPPSVVPDLKIVPREGGYARGQEGLEQILHGAFRILVDHGFEAFTLRRIAAECGMSQGNLSYYFPSKQELFQALIAAIAAAYEDAVETILLDPQMSAEDRFRRVIGLILTDITSKKTTRVFTQLWSLANHDPFVQNWLEDVYHSQRKLLESLIGDIDPQLSAAQREILALFISASLEGMTIFAGFEKPWRFRMPWIEPIAIDSFLHLIRAMREGPIGIEPLPGKAEE